MKDTLVTMVLLLGIFQFFHHFNKVSMATPLSSCYGMTVNGNCNSPFHLRTNILEVSFSISRLYADESVDNDNGISDALAEFLHSFFILSLFLSERS